MSLSYFQETEFQALCKEHKDMPLPPDYLLTLLSSEHNVFHCIWGISLYHHKKLRLQMQDSHLPSVLNTGSPKTRALIHAYHD